LEPECDGSEDGSAAVGEGELGVAGGKSPPLLAEVEGTLNNVASLVVLDVVTHRPAALAPAASAVSLLIGGLRNDRDNPAGAQMLPDRPRRVGLVAADPVRAGTRAPLAWPGHAEVVHQDREHRRVPGLARSDEDHQGQASPVDEVMDLRTQPAPRPADAMISGLVPEFLVTRQDPLCFLYRGAGSLRADERD
jgi:hypothetical protein